MITHTNTVLYFTAYDEISMGLCQNHATIMADENFTKTVIEDDTKWQAYIPLLTGSISRLPASLATAPSERIRTCKPASCQTPCLVLYWTALINND